MLKNNIVIIHSFPTNSILLNGLKEFLQEYFNVYFIDLPGFINNILPLKKVSINNYAMFVRHKINKLKLSSYWLVGVSFGFLVANNVKIDDRCRGFIAIEPFLNINYLQLKTMTKYLFRSVLNFITAMKLHNLIYSSKIFKFFFTKITNAPKTRVETILDTINSYSFFETANIIFSYTKEFEFQNHPYVLVININDNTVYSKKTISIFKNHQKCLVINTTSEHYPKNPSKEYFRRNIRNTEIIRLLKFININN